MVTVFLAYNFLYLTKKDKPVITLQGPLKTHISFSTYHQFTVNTAFLQWV